MQLLLGCCQLLLYVRRLDVTSPPAIFGGLEDAINASGEARLARLGTIALCGVSTKPWSSLAVVGAPVEKMVWARGQSF